MELYPRDSLSNMTTTECNASPNRAKKQKMACATNISKSIHEVLRYACQPKSQAKRNVSRRRKYEKPSRVKCGITLFCRGITSHSNNGNRRCHKGSISRIRTMLMMSFDECLVIAVFLHLSLAIHFHPLSSLLLSARSQLFPAPPRLIIPVIISLREPRPFLFFSRMLPSLSFLTLGSCSGPGPGSLDFPA